VLREAAVAFYPDESGHQIEEGLVTAVPECIRIQALPDVIVAVHGFDAVC